MKKIYGIFLAAVFIVLLTACDNSTISGNGVATDNLESVLPEKFIILDAGEWPQNEYTVNIPPPESGELLRGRIDPDKEYCDLELIFILIFSNMKYCKKILRLCLFCSCFRKMLLKITDELFY